MNIHAIVLAAGKGTRMKSSLYKVMHPVCGKPMIEHVTLLLEDLSLHNLVVVIGHGAEAVKEQLGNRVQYAYQHEQLGTGHAVWMANHVLADKEGVTIVINGDTPLVKAETLRQLLEHHQSKQAAATVLTSIVDDPTGYGRIIRDENGDVRRIVEEKDATLGQRKVREISTGIFCFDNQKLFQTLPQVTNNNAQGEYYLPDVLSLLQEQGNLISAYATDDPTEGTGVNDRVQLAHLELLLRKRINERHMRNGVTMMDPATTYIDADVVIGRDTVIYPGTVLRGNTQIGEGCQIGPHVEVTDTTVDDFTRIPPFTSVGDAKKGNKLRAVGGAARIEGTLVVADARR
ncbi:bifunctional UDP-N-acetylglucosamine diphosphorylase/glucosamine-1-phosphate N-acetyltransferase GlmU [Brevibacillus sp. SIMBA_040]|uniref:bifunctional UDP-N-acetylglucosamine diphosphorylase/glucosamine-1-phosphate N-acetyltransferase GlmU n=1 Tax=unclassified Brevibacillus TaxID=2684853 RepID=UPI00397A82A2